MLKLSGILFIAMLAACGSDGAKGEKGAPGATGEAGETGATGENGMDGEDGTSCSVMSTTGGGATIVCDDGTTAAITPPVASLVSTGAEAPGVNCADGGIRIDQGPDTNGNGTLDADEIAATEYVCNGGEGAMGNQGYSSLVALNAEPAGANCADGGVRVDAGLDTNANSTLEASEIAETYYVCNGADGANGLMALVSTSNEPAGANCGSGGVRVDSGVDANANSTLEASEIQSTSYVCAPSGCDPATEVAYQGRCYYLDGAPCQAGDQLAPQSVLNTISADFVGKTYKTTQSGNCCIVHADQAAEGQDWGFDLQCNSAGPFTEAPTLGASGCTDQQNAYSGQLTFCVAN